MTSFLKKSKTFLANRKGNSKRYPPCDTDTLRKITAVQCLMEIVSSEQEITNIENLVDELCEKLIDIEKQSTSLEEDEDLQIAAVSELKTTTAPSLSSLNNSKNEELSSTAAAAATTEGSKTNETNQAALSSSAVTRKANQQIASDVEDPRKRYYRAFPALSKEMEDSIGLLRRNTKSLTWPVDGKNNNSSVVKNITLNTNAVIDNNTSSNSLSTAAEKVNIKICVDSVDGPSALLDSSQGGDCNTVLCNTAGVKRKSKRRRNQALSKGKTTAGNNIRKNSFCGGSSSPTWDTDFEGSWEMGRDLIKEFIVKQNNRNRSTSESAAYNMAIGGSCANNSVSGGGGACETTNEIHDKHTKSIISDIATKNESMAAENRKEDHQTTKAIKNNNKNNMELAEVLADPCVVEVSLCENIVENSKSDDMSDMTEGSLSTARRLYERDISNDSLNEQNLISQPNHNHPQQPFPPNHHQNHQQMSSVSSSLSEQLDFAQFKAKFNSSVEALWKTTSNTKESANNNNNNNNNDNQSLLQSNIVTDSAISVAPPRSEDLKNFWTNYYSHRYDVDKFKECFDYSKSGAKNSSVGGSVATQNDGQNNYFSMPIISTAGDEFDKSVGGKRAGGKTSPIGVFLQSTIWSENSNASYPDTDESFFMKVLNSTSTTQKPQDQLKMDISGTDKSYFYPYQASKWSEGINAGPNVSTTSAHFLQQPQQQQHPLVVTSSSSSSSVSTMDHSARSCYNNEFADSTTSSSSSYISGNPNWHLPAGNNLQADIKSWSSSNPTSLTELYGGGGGGSLIAASLGKKNSCSNFDRNAGGGVSSTSSPNSSSKITLANHSTTTSGFLAYSRIKSYAKLIDPKPITKWQKPEVDYHKHLAATPPDDENLLTSERTHFHPIKMSYADGHTFEISSNLDTVDFERSESGYLYLESEKYLEYTRSDTLAEEDSSVAGHYQQSLSSSMSRDCTSSVASTKSSQSEFMIRFRVKNTDQACQTDSNVIGSNGYRTTSFNNYQQVAASTSHLALQASHNSTHDSGDNGDDDDEWMDIGCIGGIGGNLKDDEECVSMDQWSMVEITKKCMDNNNASHTLWGMCPTCNSDIKSNPANRLLKAELNVEGDEIMSDLRYMQDLYIGNDWDDQNCTRDDVEDDDDTDLDAETIRDCEFYQAMATPAGCGDMEEEDQQQKEILYNVNKLIADLLRPENAHSLANALGAVGVGCIGGGAGGGYGLAGNGGGAYGGADRVDGGDGMVVGGTNDEKYIGGLWNSDENIIWKKEFKPIDIFSRFNNNNNYSFLDKLNWEYSNLAEIWDKASPEKQIPSNKDSVDEVKKEENDDEINENQPTTTQQQTTDYHTDDEENIKIACRNMKNLLKSSTNIMPPNENSALFEINERRLNDSKRMQCFLNSNKFKISNRFDRKRRHSASQNVCSSSMNNNNNNNTSYNNNNNSIIYDNNNSKFSLASPDSSSTILLTSTPSTTNNNNTNNNSMNNTTSKAITKDTLTEYDRNIITRNDNHDNDDDDDNDDENDQHYYSNDEIDDDQLPDNQQRQATIITCKYWTTMQPIVNSSSNNTNVKIVQGDNTRDETTTSIDDAQTPDDSFFIDKNSQFIDGLPSITLNTSSILKHVTLVSRPLTR
ncbi:probable serine/threonine-protein kinase DDB_G0282963 isoform X2 [Episyrphus balteatus]|uniref:probable serine/threonine-protein kinase DDB_G0282963 isoform X2 n=1 Tax=Episyrphus balteatus TaxID=286459 RepID=UPI0024869C02|nr:probable serine/threonine-protein kinase DDB_G0282963 isoform X2 [Episyrphus balteatus]XP_055846721.1 probable serine/threonine-protein kinase DDB_G0282963 isoform X2 [Episyrphus balteatus]XP_055846722.1 probable serine/threonine-protein kinase DDB_G0282963 isoform X2 [Episyrphus balteatus]XP_055846724.1 probable serine/threonine-protein kinase DDB_G0282963 isoform X2 [Episyrphus balteatus]XP_055846725.1 probable serine/threonine-protein kinase DDB_G0282963 isoform X2 [Episyrphus balteatus]